MKGIRQALKRWRRDRRGFTLAELTIAMAIGSIVMGGVFLVYYQLFVVTATNSNYMVSFRQVQNAGDWITNDTLMAQEVYEMADTTLDADISASVTEIGVSDTVDWTRFPESGVICIGNELIPYTGIDTDDDEFTGCTRGSGATSHDIGDPVTFFVSVGWTDWDGKQHQVVYNLNDEEKIVRSYLEMESVLTGWVLQSSDPVAEAIDASRTSSDWNQSESQLEVQITANAGGYILGRFGRQSQEATRIYKIHPRPLI